MPFIGIKTANKLTPSQKLAVKAGMGQAVELIPAKKEEKMMMSIEDGENMYFRGEEKASCAFVQVILKDEAAFEDKAAMTAKIFDVLEQEAGIAKDDTYVNIQEYPEWGSRGVLKK